MTSLMRKLSARLGDQQSAPAQAADIAAISHFSQYANPSWEPQPIENKEISHVSHFSQPDHRSPAEDHPEILKSSPRGTTDDTSKNSEEVARESHVFEWEKWETWKKPDNPDASISQNENHDWEKWENNDVARVPVEPLPWSEPAKRLYGLIRALPADQDPCPGYRTGQWRAVRQSMLGFLSSSHLDDALALGWTELDLLAVHRSVGVSRLDCCGSLVLPHSGIALITPDSFRFNGGLAHYRKPMPSDAVPLWEAFGGRAAP